MIEGQRILAFHDQNQIMMPTFPLFRLTISQSAVKQKFVTIDLTIDFKSYAECCSLDALVTIPLFQCRCQL